MEDEEELAQFEEAMSEEGLDSQQEDMHGVGDGAGLADPTEGEADADATNAELAEFSAEEGEADEDLAGGSDSPQFEVPEEFGGSIEKWAAAQREALERANAELGQAKESELYHRQLLARQQQQSPQQQQAQQTQHQGLIQPSKEVLFASAVIGTDAFTQFPAEIQEQAKAYVSQQRIMKEQFWANPNALMQQAAQAVYQQQYAQTIAPLEAELRTLKTQRFRDQHPELLGSPEGRAEFLEASQKSRLDLVLENMRLKRSVESSARSSKSKKRKEKDNQARSNAQRGTSRRPKQRAGRAQPKLSPDQAANPRKVADAILKEHGLA